MAASDDSVGLCLNLRVIDAEGGRPSLRQALAREAFTVVGAVPFAGPLLAIGAWAWIIVTIRSNPLRQGKHDSIAGRASSSQLRRRFMKGHKSMMPTRSDRLDLVAAYAKSQAPPFDSTSRKLQTYIGSDTRRHVEDLERSARLVPSGKPTRGLPGSSKGRRPVVLERQLFEESLLKAAGKDKAAQISILDESEINLIELRALAKEGSHGDLRLLREVRDPKGKTPVERERGDLVLLQWDHGPLNHRVRHASHRG